MAGGYISIGCYNEIDGRALQAKVVANSSMTVQVCAAFCLGFTFFGVEYGRECYCDNGIPSDSLLVTDGRCFMPCASNSSQICGGPNGLSMYQVTPPYIGNQPTVGSFSAMGCYAEKPNDRALEVVYESDRLTIELCAAQAALNGYAYFGTEFGQECWMGDHMDGAKPANQSSCNVNCPGNSFQTCGGGNFLQDPGLYVHQGVVGFWQLSPLVFDLIFSIFRSASRRISPSPKSVFPTT